MQMTSNSSKTSNHQPHSLFVMATKPAGISYRNILETYQYWNPVKIKTINYRIRRYQSSKTITNPFKVLYFKKSTHNNFINNFLTQRKDVKISKKGFYPMNPLIHLSSTKLLFNNQIIRVKSK